MLLTITAEQFRRPGPGERASGPPVVESVVREKYPPPNSIG